MLPWETDPSMRDNELGAAFADVWCAIPKVVFSRTLDSVQGNARLAEASVAEEAAAALDATDEDVSIGGAGLAAAAIELGLVDEPLAPPLELGQTAQGHRRIVPLTGGTFSGPEMSGRLLPGASADWQIILPDGIALGDIRYILQTDQGAAPPGGTGCGSPWRDVTPRGRSHRRNARCAGSLGFGFQCPPLSI